MAVKRWSNILMLNFFVTIFCLVMATELAFAQENGGNDESATAAIAPNPSLMADSALPIEGSLQTQATVPDLTLYDIGDGSVKTLNGAYAGKKRVVIGGRASCPRTSRVVEKSIAMSKQAEYADIQFIVLDSDGDKQAFEKGFSSKGTDRVRFFSSDDLTYDSWLWDRYHESSDSDNYHIMLPFIVTIDESGNAQDWTRICADGHFDPADLYASMLYDTFGVRTEEQEPIAYAPLGRTWVSLAEGSNVQLEHLGFGSHASVSWSIGNSSVGEISQGGVVTAVSPGKTMAIAKNTLGQSAQVSVEVYSSTVLTVDVQGTSDAAEARGMLGRVNALRAERGDGALSWDAELERFALLRAFERSVRDSWVRPDRTDSDEVVLIKPGANHYESAGNFNGINDFWNAKFTNPYESILPVDDQAGHLESMGAACFIDDAGNQHWCAVFSEATGSGTYAYDSKTLVDVSLDIVESDLDFFLQERQVAKNTDGAETKQYGLYIANSMTRVNPSSVDWASSNASVATVDDTGTLTGMSLGVTTLTAKARGKAASCDVRFTASISNASVTGLVSRTYTGKAATQSPTVMLDGKALKLNVDYTVSYKNNIDAGTATLVVAGKGNYSGAKSVTFAIAKASNPMVARGKTVQVKRPKAGKTRKVPASSLYSIAGAKGKLSFGKVSGSAMLKVSTANGSITVLKGAKKKLHKAKVSIYAQGDANHEPAQKTVTVKVRLK